jgi:hypothetical protein
MVWESILVSPGERAKLIYRLMFPQKHFDGKRSTKEAFLPE